MKIVCMYTDKDILGVVITCDDNTCSRLLKKEEKEKTYNDGCFGTLIV